MMHRPCLCLLILSFMYFFQFFFSFRPFLSSSADATKSANPIFLSRDMLDLGLSECLIKNFTSRTLRFRFKTGSSKDECNK